jgi:hypothetical protein
MKHLDIITGLLSFAIANFHTGEVPFAEYAKHVNVMMPQIYWDEMKWLACGGGFNSSIRSQQKNTENPLPRPGKAISRPSLRIWPCLCNWARLQALHTFHGGTCSRRTWMQLKLTGFNRNSSQPRKQTGASKQSNSQKTTDFLRKKVSTSQANAITRL